VVKTLIALRHMSVKEFGVVFYHVYAFWIRYGRFE